MALQITTNDTYTLPFPQRSLTRQSFFAKILIKGKRLKVKVDNHRCHLPMISTSSLSPENSAILCQFKSMCWLKCLKCIEFQTSKKKSRIINPQKPFRMKDGPKLKPQSRLLTAAEMQVQIYSLKN